MKRFFIVFITLVFCLAFASSLSAETADKKELTDLLKENFNPALYTAESFGEYQTAVTNALQVYEDPAATQEQIDDVVVQIKSAREKLKTVQDKETLLYYVSNIETFLYDINVKYPEETILKLKEAKNEFLALYDKETVASEELMAAEDKFITLVEEAEEAGTEIGQFSPEEADEGIIVPDTPQGGGNASGRVTQIRGTLVIVGSVLILLGVAATILYFKPPKFLK